ncbi:MAG TPA: DUF1902 domain-containing protein [Burkholderiales bacterium]|nr:DUF1902 domain-containing protein [Burkholderiales bacterium]
MTQEVIIYANWDDEAKVWVATSEDVPGLITEAASLNELVPKLKVMIPEMLDANGYGETDDDIPFRLKMELQEVAHREAA